jgi:hypothetical protein
MSWDGGREKERIETIISRVSSGGGCGEGSKGGGEGWWW